MRVSLLSLAVLIVISGGCKTTEVVNECTYGLDPVTYQCKSAPSDATGGGGANDSGVPVGECIHGVDPFTGDCKGAPDASVAGPPDEGPVAAEDAPLPVDTATPGKCTTPGLLRIGNPCTDNTDCESCLCYGEFYLAPFRFCTKDCSSGSGSSCPLGDGEFPEYACLKFTAKQINDYELDHAGICMPRCQSVEECKIYGFQYNYCPDFYTEWEGSTVQAATTCQVK